ncbi:hypothetical protein ABFA07_013222 [Porites harrisoni]
MNKGSTQDLTWEQVRRKIHGSNNVYDLVLHQQQNPHCSCTQITLARPWPINPEVSSSEVTADASSNKSFKCMIDVDPDYCADVLELQWRFNDSSAPIKSGKKYKIHEKNTNSKCKKEFTLTINDVTVEDKGNYSCQSICYEETTFAVFELKVKDAAETSMNAV